MKTDPHNTANKLLAAITESYNATMHLGSWKTEYIDIRVVCAPGEPDIFHKTACNAQELLDLINYIKQPNAHDNRASEAGSGSSPCSTDNNKSEKL